MSNGPIVEYKLLVLESNKMLNQHVTAYLEEGWELYGPPIITAFPSISLYGQAVIRKGFQK